MFLKKFHTGKSEALRSSKLRLENLEERQLLTAVGAFDVPYGPEPASVVCAASVNVDESPAINLTEVASSVETEQVLATTGGYTFDVNSDMLPFLRDVIEAAEDGDTIKFDSDLKGKTFNLEGEQLVITKGITFDATACMGDGLKPGFTINAGGNSRAMYINAGTSEYSVVLKGLAITNGCAEDGGGIYINTGTLEAMFTTISGNKADNYGGGVYVAANGTATLTHVDAYSNVATKNGGAVFNADGATLTVNCGTFGGAYRNKAHNGGAFANYGTMNIAGEGETNISGNVAEKFGGAYFGCGTLEISGNARFSNNDADFEGGAIYNDVRRDAEGNAVSSGIVSITGANNYFCANESGDRGGAIMSYSTLEILGEAEFVFNGSGYGGAINVGTDGKATLGGNLTFGGSGTYGSNTANFGGAIFSTGDLTFLDETDCGNSTFTFTGNTAKSGGAIDACAGTLTLAGTFTFKSNQATGDYDDDQSGLGGAIATAATTTVADDFKNNVAWGSNDDANTSTYGTCVAINTTVPGSEAFGLEVATANSYSLFKAKSAGVSSPAATMIPQMIEASAVAATITVDGVSTTFGEEGVTPKELGLGAGTYDALVQYTDADGATSEVYSLVLTVGEGASIDVCETTIANGRGVKFDFNLTKADGRAVSLWEISWGDGTTTRSENLSSSWMAAHYYAQDGTFDVALKVTYLDGTSETFEAFATRMIGTPLTTTVLDAAFADVDELFVELESPLVYGPAFVR